MKNSRRIFLLGLMGTILLTAGACVANAPTPTPEPPSPVPATTQPPAPTATPAPTSTPAPTVKPSSTPLPSPTATAMLDAQDFYGTWTVFDKEAGGPDFLTFNADGTFKANHGLDQGQLLHEGNYTLEGNKITFLSWWYCDADQQVGSYLIKLYPDKSSIRFFPVDEPCEDRANDFTNRIILWDRFVPTATPAP